MTDPAPSLTNRWYFAMPAHSLKTGAMVRKVMLGQPVLFSRDEHGAVFAIRDMCPHRGVPLSAGERMEEAGEVRIGCPYHGWQFGKDGHCRLIPCLVEGQEMDVHAIRVRHFPVQEQQGLIWFYLSDAPVDGPLVRDEASPPSVAPRIEGVGDRAPDLVLSTTVALGSPEAAIDCLAQRSPLQQVTAANTGGAAACMTTMTPVRDEVMECGRLAWWPGPLAGLRAMAARGAARAALDEHAASLTAAQASPVS